MEEECCTIGFVGDTGIEDARAGEVYSNMASKHVGLIVQNGDLDYRNNPQAWVSFLEKYAKNTPVLVSSGNHEEDRAYGSAQWYGEHGYKSLLTSRLKAQSGDVKIVCHDLSNYGERYYCKYCDSLVVLLGWKQTKSSEEIQESFAYLRQVLSESRETYKFCIWHQPEGFLNPGSDHTEEHNTEILYETCRNYSAVIVNGHSHVYSRTKLLAGFKAPTPQISNNNDNHNVMIRSGESVSFVVGMSGYEVEYDGPYANRDWFASRFTQTVQNNDNTAGSLICDMKNGSARCGFWVLSTGLFDNFTLHFTPISSNSTPGNKVDAKYPASLSGSIMLMLLIVVTLSVLFILNRSKESALHFDRIQGDEEGKDSGSISFTEISLENA